MTDDLADPQQWRDSIGARVGTLEATVRTEAHLRATMDFDMGKMQAEFRAQRSMLQALHDTQQDHTRRLTGVEGRLTGVEGRLTGVEGRLTGVEGRLTGVEGRLTGVEDRLTGVEDRLTGVEDRLGNVEAGLDLVRAGVEAIHGKLDLLIDRN
jgi:chromosome segregation ATPase